MLNAHFINYTRDKQDLPAETRSTAVRVRTLNTNMKALQQKISQYGLKHNGIKEIFHRKQFINDISFSFFLLQMH